MASQQLPREQRGRVNSGLVLCGLSSCKLNLILLLAKRVSKYLGSCSGAMLYAVRAVPVHGTRPKKDQEP